MNKEPEPIDYLEQELNKQWEDGYREGYNKAISEFSETLRLECLDSCFKEVHLYTILKMADKMKGGE